MFDWWRGVILTLVLWFVFSEGSQIPPKAKFISLPKWGDGGEINLALKRRYF
jgi:hypothetical protein